MASDILRLAEELSSNIKSAMRAGMTANMLNRRILGHDEYVHELSQARHDIALIFAQGELNAYQGWFTGQGQTKEFYQSTLWHETKQIIRNLNSIIVLLKAVTITPEPTPEILEPTPKLTFNYTSIYGTFTTLAETEQEAYSMFLDWLEQKDKQVTPELEIKETWWVVRPSGIIEQLTVTQKFKDTMTAQGWIFSKEKPTIDEPQNKNISVVFYIGKGGDLKTHFGINSIVVTPDEAEQLAGWLYQNYNTKILFVMNRLTDDVRTHTLQQLKDLIIQKLKDDEPVSDDITSDDIKKPKELGFMGAGMAGAIAGLVLLGFIVDHKVGK